MRAFASSVLDEFVSLFVIQIRRLQNFDGWAKNMIYYDWGLPLAQSRVSNLRVCLHWLVSIAKVPSLVR